MSSHSHHSSESDRESIKSLLKQLAQDFQSLSYRQLQYETQIKERVEHFALMKEELIVVKEKDEYNKLKKVLMHLALEEMILLGNKILELMTIINHPLGELKE